MKQHDTTKLSAERNFSLGLGPFYYADLFDTASLKRLFEAFLDQMGTADPVLAASYNDYLQGYEQALPEATSELLLKVASHVGRFVAQLFDITHVTQEKQRTYQAEETIFAFKHEFVGKRLRKRLRLLPDTDVTYTKPNHTPYQALEAQLGGLGDAEWRAANTAMAVLALYQEVHGLPKPTPARLEEIAQTLSHWLGVEVQADNCAICLKELIDMLETWHIANMQQVTWPSYHTPAPVPATHQNLVAHLRPDPALPEKLCAQEHQLRPRDGFDLTDTRMTSREIGHAVDYCLYCHVRQKDSCRHGLLGKQGHFKVDPKGVVLSGCPLDERISEAHTLRRRGELIAALAMICLDNPMCPGTGHRICNDCMKSCIFQKQEPVNIPQIETSILTDVLHLPYGFEIYGLLTRWNPLNKQRPYALPYRNRNILVVGLGPAGYTLAHYLSNEGFGVVGIDGLKIEPLPADLIGQDTWPPKAVQHYTDIQENLKERNPGGFGGVAEYGITVRWDKNFLKVIHLTLARRQTFQAYGGVRFGSTLTLDDAWRLGFDHVALAAGAGRPTLVPMKNNLLRGMRMASDFLMGLQLSGAFQHSSLANMQIELPAIVIGGGLTAIDTATEVAAYYPVQVEKLLCKVEQIGLSQVLSLCDAEEQQILHRMLDHAQQVRAARVAGKPNIADLINSFGGVQVIYRRSLEQSPAYRLNHEEVQKALEEGISISENLTPIETVADVYGHVAGMRVQRQDGSLLTLPTRSVFFAAGTSPNTVYEREQPGTFDLDAQGRFFKSHTVRYQENQATLEEILPDSSEIGFFTSYNQDNERFVSYYGDNHPKYNGNVVKAMASAKHGYVQVARLFADALPTGDLVLWQTLIGQLNAQWLAHVQAVNRLGNQVIEIVVHAPMQAQQFQPGQFFRLQNFQPKTLNGQRLGLESLALTGAWVDLQQGLVGLIALEMGVSSRLCAHLQVGEQVVLMGPTGAPTDIPQHEHVVLCGGGLGNAVLFSVAKAMQVKDNQVVYFAGYKHADTLFKREDIENAVTQVIWSVDEGPLIEPRRPQDATFKGNVVQAMEAYAQGQLGPVLVDFAQVQRLIAIGSDRMMAAVQKARHTVLASYLKPDHLAIASVNSPMQCMMKEICAQCLQQHVDPVTGEACFVFTCANQDQPQDLIDWQHLAARLKQNSLLEKVSNAWLTTHMPQP